MSNIGTATTGTMLQGAGTGAAPKFSTSTYPSTNAANTLLYASSANVMAALSTANNGILVTSNAGVPSILAGPGTTGNVLQSNAAAAPSFSTATYPSTATGTGKILRADGTNWVASTATYPDTAGTSGNILTSDGTNWVSSAPASPFSPNSTIRVFDDFTALSTASGTSLTSQINWRYSGAPTIVTANQTAANPGVLGSTAVASPGTGMCLLSNLGANPILLGAGTISLNWVIKTAILSDVTNRYDLYCGLTGITAAATSAPTDGIYFHYSSNLNSGNWVGQTTSASSTSSANSANAAVNNAYVNLGIIINAAGTSVSFYFNGTEITNSPLAATIPSVNLAPFITIRNAAGTTAADSLLIDLFYMTISLTTPR